MFNHVHNTQTDKTLASNEAFYKRSCKLSSFRTDLTPKIIDREVMAYCKLRRVDRMIVLDYCIKLASENKPLLWEIENDNE